MDEAKALRFPFASPAPLDPPTEWADLRENCPVAHITLPSGDAARLVTRYADVKQVLADPRFPRATADSARVADTESGGLFNSDMAQAMPQGGEAHQRWRRMISLTPIGTSSPTGRTPCSA
jgi:cytochrome P450